MAILGIFVGGEPLDAIEVPTPVRPPKKMMRLAQQLPEKGQFQFQMPNLSLVTFIN